MNVFSLCHHRIDFSSSPSSYRLAYSSDYRIAPISPYASPPPRLLSSPRSTTTIPPIYYPPNRPRPPSSISRIELRGPPRDDSILFRPSVQSHWPWQIILRRSPPPPPPPTPPRVGRGRSDVRRCRRPQVPTIPVVRRRSPHPSWRNPVSLSRARPSTSAIEARCGHPRALAARHRYPST